MEIEAKTLNVAKPVQNSWMTVFVASALTLSGILGVAVGIGNLGPRIGEWATNIPVAAPGLGAGLIALLSGTALGFAQRRAVLFLGLGFAWSVACSVMVRYGWAELSSGGFQGFALLYTLYLLYNGRLHPAGPNNSSKPTPLRGAA